MVMQKERMIITATRRAVVGWDGCPKPVAEVARPAGYDDGIGSRLGACAAVGGSGV